MDKFTNKAEREKGILALILLALVFASMGLFARYLATSFSVYQQVYLRLSAAFILSAVIFKKDVDFSKFKRVSRKDWFIITLRAVSYSVFGIVLFTQGILLTKYSNVSFISALPMTAILGFILLREKFSWEKLGLVLLAFAGVIVISIKDYANLGYWGRGEVVTLISTVFFALSYVARKWQSDFLNNKELTVINFIVASLSVFLVSIFIGEGIPTQGWGGGIIVAVFGAGLFNVLNVFLTNYGFQKVEAVLAGNILTLEAFFAVVLGFVFYKEVPLTKEVLGGLLIIAGVIGMNKLEAKS
jgi:drug/metabolite transporter (DMT)-like permease